MKRIFAMLALAGAVAFGAPAWAEEKAADAAAPVAAAVVAEGAAAAAPATLDAAPAAEAAAEEVMAEGLYQIFFSLRVGLLGLPIAVTGGTPVSTDLLLFKGLGDGLRPLGFR